MIEKNSLRDINAENIRTFMRQRKEATKSEIARETGLSFPTVTRLVDSLCESRELLEMGQGGSTGGRPSSMYGLNVSFSLALLIRIENREIFWYVADLGETLIDSGTITFESGLLERLDELIRAKELEYSALKAISVGIAGLVMDGLVVESYAFADMKGINIPLHFNNLTRIPVQVNNDMNLMAMGQWYRSKERPSSSVSIYLGCTGCFGAGVVLEGRVWKGVSDFAGELDFLPSWESGDSCLDNDCHHMDIVEHYTRLIRVYAAVLNPEQIVLYHNSYIQGRVDEIRKTCCLHLPEKAVPHIEISEQYQLDYESGLYAIAEKMMEGVHL